MLSLCLTQESFWDATSHANAPSQEGLHTLHQPFHADLHPPPPQWFVSVLSGNRNPGEVRSYCLVWLAGDVTNPVLTGGPLTLHLINFFVSMLPEGKVFVHIAVTAKMNSLCQKRLSVLVLVKCIKKLHLNLQVYFYIVCLRLHIKIDSRSSSRLFL